MADLPGILIVGPGRAGKDTAAEYLARVTVLRYGGSTSRHLAPHVAAHLGVSEEAAYLARHRDRNVWTKVGRRVRRADPGALVRASRAEGEIVAGVRGADELAVCRAEGLVDLVVWVANDRVPRGSTVEFGERDCDVTVPNHWGLDEFQRRLLQLARFARLPLRGQVTSEPPGSPPPRGPPGWGPRRRGPR